MIKQEDGFSTPLAITVIFSLCLLICSISMYTYSAQKKLTAYNNKIITEKTAFEVLKNFETDFQTLAKNDFDWIGSTIFQSLFEIYETYNLQIQDVSTGINLKFLNQEILEFPDLQNLLLSYPEEIISNYGWINEKYCNPDFIKKLEQEYSGKIPFPLLSKCPLYNIYHMNLPFIVTILKYCKINDADEKAILINNEVAKENFNAETIAKLCNIPTTHKLFDFIGTKTTFWKVTLKVNDCILTAVYGGIPNKENNKKIEKYILIEVHTNYEGVCNE